MNSVASQSSSSGWVGGQALGAEVLGRFDERPAEELAPEAVHHDPRGQRIVLVDEPVREPEAVERPPRGSGGSDAGTAAVTFSPRLV
jgi:hypothetical protein